MNLLLNLLLNQLLDLVAPVKDVVLVGQFECLPAEDLVKFVQQHMIFLIKVYAQPLFFPLISLIPIGQPFFAIMRHMQSSLTL